MVSRAITAACRLAGGGLGLILLSGLSAAQNWTWNYSSYYMNESVPFTQTLDGNSITITFLLIVIASCQVFNTLTKIMGWFMNDND